MTNVCWLQLYSLVVLDKSLMLKRLGLFVNNFKIGLVKIN